MSDSKAPRAPSGLSAAGKALWRSVTAGYTWRQDELKLLEQASRTADIVARLEAEVAAAPSLTVVNGAGTPITLPAVVELRLQRSLLSGLLGRLRWPDGSEVAGEWDGITASQRARQAARARWG